MDNPSQSEIALERGIARPGEGHLQLSGGGVVAMTSRECALLSHLAGRPGMVVPAEDLLFAIWGRAWTGEPEGLGVVRNTVSRLRQKIERDPAVRVHIVTVAGGYRCVPRGEDLPRVARPIDIIPPGGAYMESWDFGLHEEFRLVSALLDSPRQGCTLVAPWRAGKSWFLSRLLCRLGASDLIARLEPGGLEHVVRHQGELLLTSLALALASAVGIEETEVVGLASGDFGARRVHRWMERSVLPRVGGRLILLVEDMDRIPPASAPELFGLLASLSGNPLRPIWDRVRLVMTSAIPPICLLAGHRSRELAFGSAIRLPGLDAKAVRSLALRHGLALDERQIETLLTRCGGHPYLTRVILCAAARAEVSPAFTPAEVDAALAVVRPEIRARTTGTAAICTELHTGRAMLGLAGHAYGACGGCAQQSGGLHGA